MSPGAGQAHAWASQCPTGAVLGHGVVVGNTAKQDFGFGAVMKFLGCVSMQEACCWRRLSALVSHSLTPWFFTAQEPLSHPKFPDISLSQSPPSPSRGQESPGLRQFWGETVLGAGMLLTPVPGKVGPKASSPGDGLRFQAGSMSSHITPALPEDRALQMCLRHDPVVSAASTWYQAHRHGSSVGPEGL